MRTATKILPAALAAALLVGGAGAFAYDRAQEDRIADGITVGGVDLGGLSADQARARLRRQLLGPLSAPVIVRAHGRRFRLTAREARIAADVEGSVAEALRRSREGNVVSRTVREVSGGRVDAAIEPQVTYSSAAVARLVTRVRRAVDRPARDASLHFAATGLGKVRGRDGLEVDRAALRARVRSALLAPTPVERTVRAAVGHVAPKLTTRELAGRYGTVLTIDRANFRLRLFKHLRLVKSYPIAVGQVGLETPAGVYAIHSRAVNPAWNVPNSAWAGSLAGRTIPGGAPNNPLKARWLGIYGGVGIHGTSDRASIGSNASHGCIRMLVEDVTDLYPRVPVGTSVYIA